MLCTSSFSSMLHSCFSKSMFNVATWFAGISKTNRYTLTVKPTPSHKLQSNLSYICSTIVALLTYPHPQLHPSPYFTVSLKRPYFFMKYNGVLVKTRHYTTVAMASVSGLTNKATETYFRTRETAASLIAPRELETIGSGVRITERVAMSKQRPGKDDMTAESERFYHQPWPNTRDAPGFTGIAASVYGFSRF